METGWFYDWREWRRFRAVELAQLGWVHQTSPRRWVCRKKPASLWLAHARTAGIAGLLAQPHGGHVKLTPEQLRLVPDFLWHGAEADGFRGDVWTCPRIAKVLRWELGVSFHKDHVSRMLKAMGWTPQIPITRAIQRNEEEIERWRTETWPKLGPIEKREPVPIVSGGQPIGVLCLLPAEISKTVSFAVWLTIVSLAATFSSGLLPCLVPSAKYIWP